MNVRAVVLALAALAASAGSQAATVTLTGDHVQISYDSALVGLFGTPSLIGDTVRWFPSGSPGFSASSGAGFSVTNSTFALQVSALPGYTLGNISLNEAGDYFFFGLNASVLSGVAVSGQLRVTPLPGSTVTSPISASTTVVNSFADFATHDWSTSTAIDLAAGTVTLANVSIENILSAYVSGGAGYAFIEKKEVVLGLAVTAVPEPETAMMMLAGVGTLAFLARRRRRA